MDVDEGLPAQEGSRGRARRHHHDDGAVPGHGDRSGVVDTHIPNDARSKDTEREPVDLRHVRGEGHLRDPQPSGTRGARF